MGKHAIALKERDVHVENERLSVFDDDIAVIKRTMSKTERFDFRSLQFDSAFCEFGKEIVEGSFLIGAKKSFIGESIFAFRHDYSSESFLFLP